MLHLKWSFGVQESETCGVCRFYYRAQGLCRRYPPSAGECTDSGFPRVRSGSWCGDFEASGQKVADEAEDSKQKWLEILKQYLLKEWDNIDTAAINPACTIGGFGQHERRPTRIIITLKDG